jgi:hypothetical protein
MPAPAARKYIRQNGLAATEGRAPPSRGRSLPESEQSHMLAVRLDPKGKLHASATHMATASTSAATVRSGARRRSRRNTPAERCRAKFLRFFPDGYRDETYIEWERDYKWQAHVAWREALNPPEFKRLLLAGEFAEIAARAVRIESRTNLLFSFEKMALRDAVKPAEGARDFAEALDAWLHGPGTAPQKFEEWIRALSSLPRRQTRVLTWPLATVFGFIAQPATHMFLKPNVTREAARAYGFAFRYASKPSWDTYASLIEFAETVRRDTEDLHPRDLIDLQSFIWVQGSDEY